MKKNNNKESLSPAVLLKHFFERGSESDSEWQVLAIFKDLEERSNVVSEKAVELVVEHLAPAEERMRLVDFLDDGIGGSKKDPIWRFLVNFGKFW